MATEIAAFLSIRKIASNLPIRVLWGGAPSLRRAVQLTCIGTSFATPGECYTVGHMKTVRYRTLRGAGLVFPSNYHGLEVVAQTHRVGPSPVILERI